MYTGAKIVVRTVYGNSTGFEVKVGMHQGSGTEPTVTCDCHGSHIWRIYLGSCCMLMTWL